MHRFWVIVLGILLIGCNKVDDLMEVLAGHHSQTVVLANKPVLLDQAALTLRSGTPMKVMGEVSHVCLVLKGDVDMAPANVMDTLFETEMNGAMVNISLTLTSGASLKFSEPMQAWRKEGVILESDEFSGCASTCCQDKKKLTKGVQIKEIVVVSSKPLKVQGIYWASTDAFDGLGN